MTMQTYAIRSRQSGQVTGRRTSRELEKEQRRYQSGTDSSQSACACGGGCPRCMAGRAEYVAPSHASASDLPWSSPFHSLGEVARVEVRADSSGAGATPGTTTIASDPIATDPVLLAQFYCLWHASNYGVSEFERSAWIVSSGSGMSLDWWPAAGAFNKETFTGTIPSGAVAVVHTHPNSKGEKPSTGDQDQARKLGLPFYVVTGQSIWRTDGASESQVAPDDWWKAYKKTKC